MNTACRPFWVSIPYSSGEKCKYYTLSESIPITLIHSCFNPLFIRGKMQVGYFLAEIGGMYKKFQSLIHQGKNASSKMGIVLRFVGGVSIPYSSGEKCKALSEGKRPETLNYVFQSLIHQGKNASGFFGHVKKPSGKHSASFNPLFIRGKMQAKNRATHPRLSHKQFQSLIHQGKNAREVNCSCGAALKGSFNPLFIRGKMQAERESAAEHNVIVCKGFNPLFIRGKMQVSKMRGGDGRSGAMVSIPYSSGEKCKNEINGPGERK